MTADRHFFVFHGEDIVDNVGAPEGGEELGFGIRSTLPIAAAYAEDVHREAREYLKMSHDDVERQLGGTVVYSVLAGVNPHEDPDWTYVGRVGADGKFAEGAPQYTPPHPLARVDKLTEIASDAFFAALAAELPQIKTGDFAPDASARFDEAAKAAVVHWIEGNYIHEEAG